MCEALMELMEDVIEEKVAKGKTIEQIADDLEKTVPEIEDLIKLLESKS